MRAGTLRYRVTIQRNAMDAANAYGEQIELWSDVATVWADVLPMTGSESWKAKQVQPEATVQVTMRLNSEVTTADRLLYAGRYLYPLSVTSDLTETRILCMEKL